MRLPEYNSSSSGKTHTGARAGGSKPSIFGQVMHAAEHVLRTHGTPQHHAAPQHHTATARGPQGLPIQSHSTQKRRKPQPPSRTPAPRPSQTSRGPQGLPIQSHSKQTPRPRAPRQNDPGEALAHALAKGPISGSTKVGVGAHATGKAGKHSGGGLFPLSAIFASNPLPALEGAVHVGGDILSGAGHLAEKIPAFIGKEYAKSPIAQAGTGGITLGGKGGVKPGQVAEDLADTVVQTPSALYQMGKAGVLAAETLPGVPGKGSLKPAKALGDGLLNESVIGNLLQGKFDKAGKLAVDHPGYAAMELWGGKGAVGRSAGAAARVAGKVGKEGNVLERAGSTARAPKRAYGNVEKTRHYDKDLINKGAQVAVEKIQRSRGKDPNAMGAGEAKRYVKKRVAAIGQMNEVLRRAGRQTAKNVMHDAAPGKRRIREPKHSDLLGLMAQKVVRSPETLRPDLENFRAALVDARHGLEPHELKLNESLVKSIEKALGDREFMASPGQWFDAANEYVKARFGADQDLKKLGLLTDGQESAKQLPALMAHLGDRFTHEPHRRETTLRGERVEVIKAELADRQAELRAVESKLANRKLHERGQRRANEALERRGKALPGDENVTRLRGEVRELERELARTQHAAKKQHRQTGRLEGVAEERVKGTGRRLSAKAAEALARQEKVLDGDTPAKVNRAHSRLSATVKLHEDSALRAADAGDEAGFSSFADLLSKAQGRKRPVDRKKAAVDRAEAATEKAANPEARHSALLDRVAGATEKGGKVDADVKDLRDLVRSKQRELADALNAADRVTPKERARLEGLQHEIGALEGERERLAGEVVEHHRALKDAKGRVKYNPRFFLDGEGVSVASAKRLLKDLGIDPDDIGFLSHSAKSHGSSAYHKTWDVRPDGANGRRTGETFKHGAADSSWQAMTDDLVGAVGKADAAKAFDRTVREVGIHMFHGPKARKNAETFLKNAGLEDDFQIVRLTPLRAKAAQAEAALESIGKTGELVDRDTGNIMLEAFHAAVDGTEMHGPLTIVPKAALAEWKKVATGMQTQDGLKAFQILSQNFRRVVLPFSPKWFFGNILEAGFRSLIYGNGPFDYARGVKVLRMLDEHDRKHGTDLGAQFAARTLGGRLYGSRGRDKLHRSAEQFTDGSRIRSVVEGGSKVRQAPGVKQLLDGLGHMQDAVFGFNERLEDSFAKAAIGSHVRNEILETSHSIADMLNIGDKAIREYVEKGLTNTNKQVEFAEKLDEVLGRYSRHTSEERWVIQTFMPFWDWYRNAIVFVTKTMPLKHPVKTALLTAVDEQMIDDLRSQGNVGIFSHTDLPAFMRGMPVVDDKGDRINLQHYLPFGVGGDPGGSLESLILPQLNSLGVLSGVNWKGQKVKKANGEDPSPWDLAKIAGSSILEGQVPLLSTVRRAREGGASAYDDSTALSPKVKDEGDKLHGGDLLSKLFNPAYVTPPSTGGKRKGSKPKDPMDQVLERVSGGSSVDQALDQVMSRLGG